jgi:phospholipase/carboxylesterase
MAEPSYVHTLIADADRTGTPLVLLHGLGGTELDLVPLAAQVAPGSPVLAIRGAVAVEGGHAFFQRSGDRTIDEAAISEQAAPLADFIVDSFARHGFGRPPIAIGFSNGAVMIAALLLLRPGLLSGAVLLRPASPFSHDLPPGIPATPVLILDGGKDTRRSPGDGLRLAERLTRAGATVTHHALPVGHSITAADRLIARQWLAPLLSPGF